VLRVALVLVVLAPLAVGSPAGDVLVTRDQALGHAEPDVAVNPKDPRNLLGACQFIVGPHKRVPGAFASFDGGRTWRGDGLLRFPGGFEQGADTTVAFDARGNGFVAALASAGGGGYASRVTRGGIFIWEARDGGRVFSAPRAVFVGHGFQDHPWLAIRGTRLFLSWTNQRGLMFASSSDDGRTFSAPRIVVPGPAPQDPVVTLGPRGDLRVLFQEFARDRTRIDAVESPDDGASFGSTVAVGSVESVPASGPGPKGGTIPPPLLGAAEDPRSGAAAVAIAGRDARAGHPVVELWRTVATNGRWAGPFRPAGGATAAMTQTQPRLAFAGSTLLVSYYAFSRAGDVTTWLARSTSTGGSFETGQLSTGAFRYAGWLGDYQALAVAGASGHALWTALRSGRLEIVAGRFRAA
jgi:hypothetical protein